MPLLTVQGAKIVDDEGNEIILRGAGLGGWMTMENFISGFPGCEYQIRESLADTIGKEKAEFFFQKFLDYFFAEDDARFFHSLGLNCIRIAVSYRHFEDDMAPRVLKPNCFAQLDRDRLIWLWEQLAAHYRGHEWIAGYNVLNEPADPHPQHARLLGFYDRAHSAIRAIDADHIIFLDGNTYATDFTKFPDDAGARWGNTAFSIHDYSVYGFPKSPEPYDRTNSQREMMRRSYERKRAWMDARGLCVWNGEWGPVYARPPYDGDATDAINQRRYNVLEDQLAIYDKAWIYYMDIGFQGMVYVVPDTPYMTRFRDFLAKKYRMAVDSWGADDKYVKKVYEPIVGLIKEACPDADTKRLYPPIWSLEERVARYSRQTLVAEYLVGEWASIMKGLDEEGLEQLAKSFAFENCAKREGLNDVLRKYAPELGK
ncbi:hypothetical protein EYR36_002192 [Pleurotus pulmonarius]|nr:hypothetical protein EYR36_002192 [Pleurotus pulmonarius]